MNTNEYIIKVLHSKGFDPQKKLEEDSKNPQLWLESAEDLDASMDLFRPILKEYVQRFNELDKSKEYWELAFKAWKINGSFNMLAGYALECIFKGIIVCKYKSPKFGHKLNELVKAADIEITAREKYALDELEGYIRWRGRYPAPKYWNEQYKKHSLSEGFQEDTNRVLVEIIDPLFTKSKKLLLCLMNERPESLCRNNNRG